MAGKDLDGYLPAEFAVPGAVHFAHTAGADGSKHFVGAEFVAAKCSRSESRILLNREVGRHSRFPLSASGFLASQLISARHEPVTAGSPADSFFATHLMGVKPTARRTSNIDAYHAFLKGRQHLWRVALRTWRRNRAMQLVGFRLDQKGRLVGES